MNDNKKRGNLTLYLNNRDFDHGILTLYPKTRNFDRGMLPLYLNNRNFDRGNLKRNTERQDMLVYFILGLILLM